MRKDDILIQEHMDKKNTVYTDMINSYLAQSSDLHSTLREKGILFVEDDLCVQPNFLAFMNQGLKYYEKVNGVFSCLLYTSRCV